MQENYKAKTLQCIHNNLYHIFWVKIIHLVMLLLAGVCKYDVKWWRAIWITATPASPVPAAPAPPQPAGMSAKEREKLDIEQKLQQQREKEKAENTGTETQE